MTWIRVGGRPGRLALRTLAVFIALALAMDSFVLFRGYRTPTPQGGAFGVQPRAPASPDGIGPTASQTFSDGVATISPTATPTGVVPSGQPTPLPPPAQPPAGDGALAVPALGDYIFAISPDSAESASGFGGRSFGKTANVTVARVAPDCPYGAPRGPQFRIDVDYDPSQSTLRDKSHFERHWLVWGSRGIVERLEYGYVKFGAIGMESEVCYDGPEERVPFPLRAGTSASGQSDAHATRDDPPFSSKGQITRTEKEVGRVLARERVTIAGTRVETWKVEVKLCFDETFESEPCIPGYSRSERGFRIKRFWYAPAYGFYVKYYDRIHAERFNFAYDATITGTLKEFHPA